MAQIRRSSLSLCGGREPLLDEQHDEDLDVEFESRKSVFDPTPKLSAAELSAVLLVYLICFTDSLGSNISLPVLPFYAREFHATSAEIGYLYSAFCVATTFGLPLLSNLSDRFGRRKVLILTLLGTAAGSLGQGVATNYWTLFIARTFSGVWAGVSSVCQVYIADTVPEGLRAAYMSYLITANQAALLFGPSIGAGLSVLGLNAPALVNAAVSAVFVPIVWAHLPESEEWLRMRRCSTQAPAAAKQANLGGSTWTWNTNMAIVIYGAASFCGMLAQMSFFSMYAVFADQQFGLDSLHVGFIITLGAISSIAANIWISPPLQDKLGDVWAGILGSALVIVGSAGVAMDNVKVSLVGLMILFQGCAINNGAVSCGAANLTNVQNRSTVMTGVRMLKSLGSTVGPSIAGIAATRDIRLPFVLSGIFALLGIFVQITTINVNTRVRELVAARKNVGLSTEEAWIGGWKDEIGTPDEIADLGRYMAQILTERHYRWVTHNTELKKSLSNFYPPLSIKSQEQYTANYNWVRDRARSMNVRAELMTAQSSCN